jgi:hypothetical protein
VVLRRVPFHPATKPVSGAGKKISSSQFDVPDACCTHCAGDKMLQSERTEMKRKRNFFIPVSFSYRKDNASANAYLNRDETEKAERWHGVMQKAHDENNWRTEKFCKDFFIGGLLTGIIIFVS